jgi:hypothetical protein
MLSDHMHRLEDQVNQLHAKLDDMKRWSKFDRFMYQTKGPNTRLYKIISHVDPYWIERVFAKHYPVDQIRLMIYWIHTDKLTFGPFESRMLHMIDAICNEDEVLRSIWSELPIQEIDKFVI